MGFLFHLVEQCLLDCQSADWSKPWIAGRILHRGCFIEFIKQVEEKPRQASHFIFRNEFNKYNDTGARMLDSINHMTLNYF